eukprot:CAMPEP_0172168146 /NCGR_PEP_ID=MMETSP1050-20130122/9972_1 /TAXON_ID=233186 /ORGANISM="Cryptomonas curvata, Strain CCAP979/52" /LENGTH=158 /DNA_ID=CAMNT_0012839029 /DNA_START=301 /DNA_END=774 /DNA_ORIENTATION=+
MADNQKGPKMLNDAEQEHSRQGMDTPAAAPGELNGATAAAEPPIFSESEYRLLLLNHWRMRVCGGNLREHDLGLSKAAQERHRKRRREDTGFLHPMLDAPPAIFSAFDSVWPEDSYVEAPSEDEEEEERHGQFAAAGLAAAGIKKPRGAAGIRAGMTR